MRRRVDVLGTALLLWLLLLGCRGGHDRPGQTASDTASPATQATTSTTGDSIGRNSSPAWPTTTWSPPTTGAPAPVTSAPPAPRRLRIVADGGTAFQGSLNPEVSYGAVLHNPNTNLAAVGVSVVATFVDAAGRHLFSVTSELDALPPGQFTAVGATGPPSVLGDGSDADAVRLASIRYRIMVDRWVPASTSAARYWASGVRTETGDFGMQTSATLRSSFRERVSNVTFVAIYYGAAGRLAGAAYGCTDEVDPGAGSYVETDRVSPIPGVRRSEVYAQWKSPQASGAHCRMP
jgi:hypothetical protein